MGKYTDAALAAHAAAKQAKADAEAQAAADAEAAAQAQAEAEAAARQSLIDAARTAAAPLWKNPADGKPLFDVAKQTRAEHVDEGAQLVILSVLDSKLEPEVSFAVYPDRPEARVVTKVDGKWTGLESPPVRDLDDVGAVLAGDI